MLRNAIWLFCGRDIIQTTFRWDLGFKGFHVLDPRRVKFEVLNNRIEYVKYKNRLNKEVRIPYKKCIHIVGGLTTPFSDPYGSPECKRAYPYYQAKQTIMAEMTIAAKNNATGIWLGYTDPNTQVQVYGSDGRPIKNADGSRLFDQRWDLYSNSFRI